MKMHHGFSGRGAILTVFAAGTFCAAFFDVSRAAAAEIKLMATGAMRSAFEELAPQFERATGHRVTTTLGVIVPLKRRIDAGESFDIVVLSPALIDDLIKARKVEANTRAEFARTGLGIGVPKGAAKPDVTSVDALKRAFLNAKSVGYEAESQPGTHFLEVIERLGIAQEMRPKLKALPNPSEALAKREVEMHISSVAALLGNPAADFAGGFPREVQRYVDFTAGISATTKESEAAKALLSFLMSPGATSVFKAKGFERN
jgi:molybdate transport system substrate-binding protein